MTTQLQIEEQSLIKTKQNTCEEFLQEARELESLKINKNTILNPYKEQILFAYNNGIKITTILKVLQKRGIKAKYDNVRSYIRNNKEISSSNYSKKTQKIKKDFIKTKLLDVHSQPTKSINNPCNE